MMNNHNYTSKQQQQQQQQQTTTTDAIIIQSNTNVVTDEFLQQLQDQFGGENKQIYILNTNNSGTSLTSVNSDSSSASLTASNTNNNVQYLIVDKDVDINLILQDPSIFGNNQQQTPALLPPQQITQQPQSIIEQVKQPVKQYITNTTANNTNNTRYVTNSAAQSNGLNQMLAVEESIQRVQAPPPKRKQFELKLENKKNSYQDVFLRYLAGEKQPTLEIMQSEYTHSAAKKPKDNLNYSVTTTSNAASTANNKTAITNNSTNKIIIPNSPTTTVVASTTTTTTATTTPVVPNQPVNLDKENYYNSSRRENLLPLNNYEYRNSYKDHYDNQGVRVNPAVLKNLSFTASSPTTVANANATPNIPTSISRSVNIPAKKLNEMIAPSTASSSSSATSQSKIIVSNKSNSDLYSTYQQTNGTSVVDHQQPQHHNKLDASSVQSAQISTTTKPMIISDQTSHVAILNEHLQQQQQQVIVSSIESTTLPAQAAPQQQAASTQQQQSLVESNLIDDEEITFQPGEFLIHRSTFSGDFNNYDIWCVREDGYLQKYEPVLLATGERCHQSADVLAQYTPDKAEFVLVKVEEKGKTEQDNIVVGVLPNYEPKNRKTFNSNLAVNSTSHHIASSTNSATSNPVSTTNATNGTSNNVLVVTYDDLKATLDVFLQALLSQNINNEFLIKLKEIQEEYFKPSIEFIDSILNEKYVSLMNSFSQFMTMSDKNKVSSTTPSNKLAKQQLVQLESMFKYLIETKPKLISQSVQTDTRCRCQAILFLQQNDLILYDDQFTAQYVVKFAGQEYNNENLLPASSDASATKESKEFLVCAKTLQFAQLCHTIKHLKFNFYEICQQKIEIVKQINSNSGASEILNDCLADSQWLLEMFEKFKQLLFEVDNLIGMTQNETSNEPSNHTANAQLESQSLLNHHHHMVVDQVPNNLIDDIQLHH